MKKINSSEMEEDTIFLKKRNRKVIKNKSGLRRDERRKKWNKLMKEKNFGNS